MAYNKAKEEYKWKVWKEQEEKLLENLEEQRAIWAEQDQQKTGAKSEGRPGDGKEQLKDLVSAETVKKQINEFTGSEIAEKLADAERELWIRSVWEQHWLKQKRKELTEQNKWLKEPGNKEEFLKKGELSIPAVLLSEIVKNSNITFLPVKENKNEYIEYYKILSDFDSGSIGGKIPDNGIFYEK